MKLGLGDSYENVSVLPEKVRAYIDITKPASTVGVAGGFMVASLLYFFLVGDPSNIGNNTMLIIHTSVTVAVAHGASQAMNMAEDAEIDKQTPHKQNRPIPSGVITKEEARSIAWVLSVFAIGRSFLVGLGFGIMVTIGLGLGIFYNLEPIRAKERIVSIPWQACSRGLLSIPTVWVIYGDIFNPLPWFFGFIMFLYVLAFQNTADIIDEEVDAEYGISTWVVEFGMDTVVTIATGCTFLMLGMIIIGVQFNILPLSLISLLLIIPFCMLMLWHMWRSPHMVDQNTGNHPAWLWYYAGMVLFYSLPLVTEVSYYYYG